MKNMNSKNSSITRDHTYQYRDHTWPPKPFPAKPVQRNMTAKNDQKRRKSLH